MGSNDLENVQHVISEAVAGDPDELYLDLSRERFASLGAALDAATSNLMSRGYHLAGVRVSGDDWVATYRRVAEAD
ncbi:MAG: hypothetical protein KY391_02695 [Actinobacteria bacterium]|nr:hypothetical protein [Actinomycetota bacterium]